MGSRPRRHCVAVDVEDVEVEATTGAKLTSADGDIAWYSMVYLYTLSHIEGWKVKLPNDFVICYVCDMEGKWR